MADVSSQLKDIIQRINTAVRGEDVRDAIIDAINLLKTGDGNAYSLNGHPASYFATQDDMDKILPMDATPTQYSQRPVSSGGIYELLEDMLYVIDQYINKESVSGTITDRLAYLDETRRLIRNEIIAKNVSVDKNDTFRSYADKIKSIETHSEISVSSVEITESNLEYDSTKQEYTGEFDPGENNAYKPVTVTVKPALSELTVNANGEYKASDSNLVGFSMVKVDISEESGSSNLTTKKITSEDLPDEPGEVTFKAKDEQKIGYSQVSVDVSGKFQEKSLDIDPTSYGEQQVYEAKDDGLYGWSKITITLVESEGPFTVRFYVDTALMETVKGVPKGGRANYHKGTPTKAGQTFVGWNPSPDNVTKDMDCYAEFETESEPIGFDTEIPESWADIAANGGANIPIGAYKILYYHSFSYDGVEYPGGSIAMQKVYAGEEGTTSTWLSTNGLTVNSSIGGFRFYTNGQGQKDENANGWEASKLRSFLNNEFASAIIKAHDETPIIPESNGAIVSAIRAVKKYSRSIDQHASGSIIPNAETSDRIWIVSNRECNNAVSSGSKETAGPIYTIGKTESGEPVTMPSGYEYEKGENSHMLATRSASSFSRSGISPNPYTLSMYEWNPTQYSTHTFNAYYYVENVPSGQDPNTERGHAAVLRIGFCT